MDDRPIPGGPGEVPLHRASDQRVSPAVTALDDPRALTILTTEHWSLLSARSLVYNEAFARGGMFLTFVSATLVALGLVSTATGFSREFLSVAAVLLALDLFIGVASMARIASATGEDIRYLQGMNRLRHAYHETVPGLEQYFISGSHDDTRGVFAIYGSSRPSTFHGFTTMPGMMGVICAAIAGGIAGILVVLATDNTVVASGAALLAFALGVAASSMTMVRRIARMGAAMDARFPSAR